MVQRVGKHRSGTKKDFTYVMCTHDADGWVKACDFLPEDYDMCYLKLSDGRSKRGWFNGYCWDGLRIKVDDEIVYWKRSKDNICGDDK